MEDKLTVGQGEGDLLPVHATWLGATFAFCALLTGMNSNAQATNLGDCDSAAFVCSDTLILGSSFSVGEVNDLLVNHGCLSNEHSSAWIRFSIASDGTLGFLLSPDYNSTDLDFAVWGPYTEFQCPQPTEPTRCSFATGSLQGTGIVGLLPNALDTSEVAPGDGILAELTVHAGELYVLYINNFSATSDAVGITWNLSQGASLSCSQPISTTVADVDGSAPEQVRVLGDMIDVSVAQGEFTAHMVDMLGREVLKLRGTGNGAFNIASLAPGRYAVVIENARGRNARSVGIVIP